MKTTGLTPWTWFRKDDSRSDSPALLSRRYGYTVPAAPLFLEMDRIFDSLLGGQFPHRLSAGKDLGEAVLRPNLDISGDETRYFVSVELPGVDEQDLRVELDNDVLRICGEKRHETQQEETGDGSGNGRSFYRVERAYGSFQRELSLPDDVDASGITAVHKDGVLTITLPRREAVLEKARRIEIARK